MHEVRGEVVTQGPPVDIERVRFRDDTGERALAFLRFPPADALEVQLLPFLARRSERVPRVHARGIPPPASAAKPWVLIEDVTERPSACDVDPPAIVAAKAELERAVRSDGPALRALGLREVAPREIAAAAAARGAEPAVIADAHRAAALLEHWPASLVHGDLACQNAPLGSAGVLLLGWRHAHLGCALLDVVRLTADLVGRGEAVLGIGLSRVYADLSGRTIGTEELRAAELLERLFRRYVRH